MATKTMYLKLECTKAAFLWLFVLRKGSAQEWLWCTYLESLLVRLWSLSAVIRAGTHLTFGLVLGDMVIKLNPGFVTLGGGQSTSICLPGHLQSLPVFLTMVGYDIAPQREKSLRCTHLSLLILLSDALVPQSHNQTFSHISGAALVLFIDCFLQFVDCHQNCLCPPQWNQGRKNGKFSVYHLAIHLMEVADWVYA